MRKGDRTIPRPAVKQEKKDRMGYHGEVTVQVRDGEHVLKEVKSHNDGRLPLFEFLMFCITGNYDPEKRPANLMAFGNGNPVLSKPIVTPARVSWSKTAEQCSATLTWTISFSYIKTGEASIDALKIYSRENSRDDYLGTPSAEVSLESSIDLTAGNNLLVAWKMAIGNSEN